MSSESKKDVYISFLAKKRFHSSFSKSFKRILLGTMLASLILLSGVFVFDGANNNYWNVDSIGEGYVGISLESEVPATVYADTIGEIIETSGGVQLFHDGKEIVAGLDKVSDSDRILLEKDSEIVFVLSDNVQAKILGPAEFELYENIDGYYVINMLDGDLVELTSVFVENVEINKEVGIKTVNVAVEEFYVVVKTTDYEVTSPTSLETIALTLQGNGNTNIIHNQGDKVLIKKIIDDTYVVKTLESDQIASIKEEISIFEGLTSNNKEEINLKDLKIVYTSGIDLEKNENKASDTIVQKTNVVSTFLPTIDNKRNYDTNIYDELAINDIVDDAFAVNVSKPVAFSKRVMSPEQSDIFSSSISSSYMIDSARQILFNTYIGNAGALSTYLNKIKTGINVFSRAFDLGVFVDASSVPRLLSSVSLVQAELNKRYYVPPSLDSDFGVIKHWLSISSGVIFGSAKDCDIDCLAGSNSLTPAQKVFLKGQ